MSIVEEIVLMEAEGKIAETVNNEIKIDNFASYFRERDHHELKLIESEKDHNWKYLKLRD